MKSQIEKDIENSIKRPESPTGIIGVLFCKKCNSRKSLKDIKIENKDNKTIFKCNKCGSILEEKRHI